MLKEFYTRIVRFWLVGVLGAVGVVVCGEGYGQDTLAIQDFEVVPATPTYGYTGGGGNVTGNGAYPSDPKYVSGIYGHQVNNGTKTLTFNDINTSLYSDIELNFRLASFSGTSGNGAESSDYVVISVSDDDGLNWSEELKITGYSTNNAYWSFISGTGVASTDYDGNNLPIIFSPGGSGSRTTDGYNHIKLSELPSVDHLKVKIQLKNNSSDELWVIDDVLLTGILAVTTTTVDFSSATYTQTEDGTSINLCVDITNEDATATTAEVKLVSGSATELDNYTTQTVTFPTSSATQQCVTINITDNSICDGDKDYTFELQNVSGGNSAVAGSQDNTVLTVTDDDSFTGNIVVQDFDGTTPVWNYTGDGTNSNTYGNTGKGRRIGGTQSFKLTSVPTTGLSNMLLAIRNSKDPADGIENDDALKIYVNLNGSGYPANPDITIQGTSGNNKSWLYSATGLASTTAGTPATFYGDGATGNATIQITIPDGTSSVEVKIQSDNNKPEEYYYIDDITLYGEYCNSACIEPTEDPEFHANTPTFVFGTLATFKWFSGDGANRLMILKEGSAVTATPVDGTTYPASAAFGSGYSFGTNEYAVYNGPGNEVDLTNLSPGTEYFAKIFEYNCFPGSEDYYTSGTPDTDVFITPPENPASFIKDCVGSTSIDLSWTAPTNGNYDGYLLVVREGTNPPLAVTSLNPSSQAFNSNYSTAPSYAVGTPVSKVIYRGTATSRTITNLVADANYTFQLYTYSNGTSGWKYSTGTTTNQTITLAEVTDLSTTPHANTVEFSWSIDASCIDEIIVAASDVGGVTSLPSGSYSVNSPSFTDPLNPTLAPGGEKVVYSNTGSSVTITGLTTDDPYCFKVFLRKGSVWSQGVDICETPRDVTVLEPGDISIVAINTDIAVNPGQYDPRPDEICFVSYKSITANTSIDFTDNGYEREFAGKWGDTEGVIRITRKPTAPTIPAGKVICIEGYGNGSNVGYFTISTCGVEDTDWIVSSQNGNNDFNLNSSDQVWILQNGNWNTVSGTHHKATYTGNVLYGWTATGWKPNPGYKNTSGSTLYPNSFCLSTDLNSIVGSSDKVKYTGPLTALNRIEWIQSFNDYTKWSGFSSNSNYFNADPQYNDTCIQITINPIISTAGLWTGNADTDWFNCKNWDNLRLPEETVDAIIRDVTKDPIIGGAGAACYSLSIETGGKLTLNDPTSELNIFGNLSVEGSLVANTNGTISFKGNEDQNITDSSTTVNTINFKNLTINKTAGNLTTDEHIGIYGNAEFTKGLLIPAVGALVTFQNNATTSGASNASFIDGKVKKIATPSTNFTFPIGDTSGDTIAWYQPARIFGNTGNSTIEAEYFAEANANAGAYYDGQSNTNGDNQDISNCDYWTITKTGANINIALKYTNDDPEYCNTVDAPEYIGIFRLNPSMLWDPVGSGNIADEIVSTANILLYGDFAFGGPSQDNLNVLPITLLSFTAEAKDAQVLTSWITASEMNNDFFTIERSADARNFKPIGTVEGAGTSHSMHAYSFIDDAPLSGISYYRLKQTDFDGTATLSEIRSVEFYTSGTFSLDMAYRSEDGLSLAFTSIAPYLTVEIFDVFGQRVFGGVVENYGGRGTIHPNLSRGVYVVRLSQGKESDSRKVFW